jgi:archaetidylinositol phosphate synthase
MLGIAAVTGALLTSFIGSQAQAVGINRIKGGLISGTDRLVLMIIAGLLYVLTPQIYGYSIVEWTLALLALLGHFTGLQRFVSALHQLKW